LLGQWSVQDKTAVESKPRQDSKQPPDSPLLCLAECCGAIAKSVPALPLLKSKEATAVTTTKGMLTAGTCSYSALTY